MRTCAPCTPGIACSCLLGRPGQDLPGYQDILNKLKLELAPDHGHGHGHGPAFHRFVRFPPGQVRMCRPAPSPQAVTVAPGGPGMYRRAGNVRLPSRGVGEGGEGAYGVSVCEVLSLCLVSVKFEERAIPQISRSSGKYRPPSLHN